MAFNPNVPKADYTASAGQKLFPFLFKIFHEGDIQVYQTKVTTLKLVLGVDYTVTIDGDDGGSIILTVGADVGNGIVLQRELSLDRYVEYQTSGDLLANTLNADQDYQTYLIADQNALIGQSISAPPGTPGFSGQLPVPIPESYLRWSIDGKSLKNDLRPPIWRTETEHFRDGAQISASLATAAASNAKVSEISSAGNAAIAANAVASIPVGPFGYLPFSNFAGTPKPIPVLEVVPGHYTLPFRLADGSTNNIPILGV